MFEQFDLCSIKNTFVKFYVNPEILFYLSILIYTTISRKY